jgi:uncharacterized protein YcfJ
MKLHQLTALGTIGAVLSLPVSITAQETTSRQAARDQAAHDRAEREQTASDHRHHTGAKIVAGSAAGGAVIGGVAGGGKGALIGGAAGAGGGAIANKIRKDKDVKKREREYREDHPHSR